MFGSLDSVGLKKKWLSCVHLFCKLLHSVQPVFDVPDGGFYISSLLLHTSGHLGDAFDGSISQAFQLEIQDCHIWLTFQNWKLEAVKSNGWRQFWKQTATTERAVYKKKTECKIPPWK